MVIFLPSGYAAYIESYCTAAPADNTCTPFIIDRIMRLFSLADRRCGVNYISNRLSDAEQLTKQHAHPNPQCRAYFNAND